MNKFLAVFDILNYKKFVMKNKDIEHNIKIHDKVFKIYNLRHSEIYNSMEQARVRKIISDIVNNNHNLNVLDVGAGTGNLALKFLDLGCQVTAADVSAKSLALLKKISGDNSNLKLAMINDEKLSFADNQFDVVCTYSVLHHVPDYLLTVKEMIRICKPGGLIYIDHEASEKKWLPNQALQEYYKLVKQTVGEHLIKLFKTRELFTFALLKTAFIKFFINQRYQREGDLHVWDDDHLDWDKIREIFKNNNCEIIKEVDYLMYQLKSGEMIYNKYKESTSDTKYVIVRKNE